MHCFRISLSIAKMLITPKPSFILIAYSSIKFGEREPIHFHAKWTALEMNIKSILTVIRDLGFQETEPSGRSKPHPGAGITALM
jgi:hypothetical protein